MNPAFFDVRFLCEAVPSSLPPRFAVVTACNPGDSPCAGDLNRIADAVLARELDEAGRPKWRVTGGSPDFVHREPGWAFACPDVAEAREVALRYGQVALYWIEEDRLLLVESSSGTAHGLGGWASRTTFGVPARDAGWIQDR